MLAEEVTPHQPANSGGYRILRPLGRGGMGSVYEAVELATDRRVAIKAISDEVAETHEGLVRFQREVRLAASLSHPRCVFVYGITEVDGRPAIVMELCTGGTLQDEMDRGEPIPIARAVGWMLDILEGLSVAHAAGIVHRDVKPSNCFLTADGRVKVGDFGLALALVDDTRVTQSGAFLGSPLYASPEQARGSDVDERSDVYSAAATLYALLAGRPPFTGRNIADVLARIATEPVPRLRKHRHEAPQRLEAVISRAMAREAEMRQANAEELHSDLSPFVRQEAPAGSLGLRFTAFFIDAVAQYLLLLTIQTAYFSVRSWQNPTLDAGTYELDSTGSLIAALIMALGYGILEGLWGAGLGKWLCGLRVVSTKDTQPNLVRAVYRALLIDFAPWMLTVIAASAFTIDGGESPDSRDSLRVLLSDSLWNFAIVLALLVTMRRANGWRGIHELASGTRVIAVESPLSQLVRPRPGRAQHIMGSSVTQSSLRVGPYERVERVLIAARGEVFVGRDADLTRDVWIIRGVPAPPLRTIERIRDLDLRWLRTIEWDGEPAQVFESPGGESVSSWAKREGGISAATRIAWLTALATHLEGATAPDQWLIGVESLWVDRVGNLRVLPGELGESNSRPSSALGALAAVACSLEDLRGDRSRDIAHPSVLAVLERATCADHAFASLLEARRAFDVAGRSRASVSRMRRVAQLLVACSLYGATLVIVLLVLIGLNLSSAEGTLAAEYRKELIDGHRVAEVQASNQGAALSADSRRAREIMLISTYANSEAPEADPEAERNRQEFYSELRGRLGVPSKEDVLWASRRMTDEYDQAVERQSANQASQPAKTAAANIVALSIVLGTVLALGSRLRAGAVSFAVCGLQVCQENGRLADRRLRLLRSLVICCPFGIAGVASFILIHADAVTAAWWVLGGIAITPIVACAHAIYDPSRSLVDRIAGTRLVHLNGEDIHPSDLLGTLDVPLNREPNRADSRPSPR